MIAVLVEIAHDLVVLIVVRRAYVGGDDADDLHQRRLELDDLVASLVGRYEREVLVAPRVARDLVALVPHAVDDVGVARGRILNLPLAVVVPYYEESRLRPVSPRERCRLISKGLVRRVPSYLDIIFLEDVQQLIGVLLRPVIEGQGHLPRHGAVGDVDAVAHLPKLGPRHVGRALATWGLMRLTAATDVDLAAGREAEVSSAADSLRCKNSVSARTRYEATLSTDEGGGRTYPLRATQAWGAGSITMLPPTIPAGLHVSLDYPLRLGDGMQGARLRFVVAAGQDSGHRRQQAHQNCG